MSPNNKEEQGSVDACLQKGSALTLGYGNSGMKPFMFTVPDGQDVDVCFFKLFVTAKPVDLGSISQSSPFSNLRTSRGESPARSPPDLTGSWASMVIPILQRRVQPIESCAPQGFVPSPNSPALILSPDKHAHVCLFTLPRASLFILCLTSSMAI